MCRLCFYYSSSIPIQRIWIPFILGICVLENFLNLSSLLSLNSTGLHSIASQTTAIVLKCFKDSLGRFLLLSASQGIGIVPQSPDNKPCSLSTFGFCYFLSDLSYQISSKLSGPGLIYQVSLSVPLILFNTVIFHFIILWFSRTAFKLKQSKQEYKLKLLKQFSVVLGLGGVLSLAWGVLNIIAWFFFNRNSWWLNCMSFAIWDLVFFFIVASLVVLWRVNLNSKLLAGTQELRNQDHGIPHEDEGKFGIELSRAQPK